MAGLYDVDFRIVAACRNGTLCTLKRGWSTARTVAVLESQVSPYHSPYMMWVSPGSISSTFYEQLLPVEIPKAQKD